MAANRHSWTLPTLIAIGFVLAGCASSSGPQLSDNSQPRHHGRIMYRVEPYQVNGVWYYPKADYSYDVTGTASWYGEQFQGRATADGETYDLNQLTAAHKTLPLPSVVEVTNLQNGRSLRLRVNDRGPFVDGRIIDLSRRSAQLLGYENAGTTTVRVRILRDESIQVAQAAMHGETGRVELAQAAAPAAAPAATIAQAQPILQPIARPAPTPSSVPPSLRAPVVVASTPRPDPAPAPIRMAAAQPSRIEESQIDPIVPSEAPAPMQRAAQLPPPPSRAAADAPSPRPAAEMPRVAEDTPRRRWPSLISQAHADTLHEPLALPPPPAQKPVLAVARGSSRMMFVQAGAFAVPENAQRVRARIAALGSVEVLPMTGHGSPLYRVRVGPVASEAEAARLLSKIVDSGYPGARVVGE